MSRQQDNDSGCGCILLALLLVFAVWINDLAIAYIDAVNCRCINLTDP